MTIKNIDELADTSRHIDLTGPKGNAFYLIGLAQRTAEQLGKDPKDIMDRMQSGDYENLLEVFEEEFGEYFTLYR